MLSLCLTSRPYGRGSVPEVLEVRHGRAKHSVFACQHTSASETDGWLSVSFVMRHTKKGKKYEKINTSLGPMSNRVVCVCVRVCI